MEQAFYTQIDFLLKEISLSTDYFFDEQSHYNYIDDPVKEKAYRKHMSAINFALSEKLIYQPFKNSTQLQVTPYGYRVLRKGGWEKFLKIQNHIEKQQERKIELDLKISEFQVKTKWWPLIIASTSLIISLVAIFKEENKIEKTDIPETNQSIPEEEPIHTKDNKKTLILKDSL